MILSIRDENGNWIEVPAIQGDAGKDGKTPVKGTDYWTAADKQEIVDDVLSSIVDGEEETF